MRAARSVNDKPAFKNAMKRRRCLFPADGFYEWKPVGNAKRPYFARPAAGGPIAFAGLWETWIGPNGEEMETAAIVTTRGQRGDGRGASPRAGDRAAGAVRFLARLPERRREDGRRAVRAGAGRLDGGLRGFAGGQSRGERRAGVARALQRRRPSRRRRQPKPVRKAAAAPRTPGRARCSDASARPHPSWLCAPAPISPLCGVPSSRGATDRPVDGEARCGSC